MHYVSHLSKDRKLKKLIEAHGPRELLVKKRVYLHLCGSIMSQQLSVKVAAVIWNRFLVLFPKKEPTPEEILAVPFETLRGIGLSNAKARYVQNVAQFAIDHGMEWKHLKKMSDEEIIERLTQIKGVGRWTVEMLMMFALGREDIFAVDDLGLRQAMAVLYKLDMEDKKQFKEDILRISQRWAPYRSYASLYLWRWKDNVPEV